MRISSDPLGTRPPPLEQFLTHREGQAALSLKVTLGFLSRTRRAKPRFEPEFIEPVERHALPMGGSLPCSSPIRSAICSPPG